MDAINQRLHELRKLCGKSQEEFGKVLGITKSGVSGIENGRRKVTAQHLIMLGNWAERPVNTAWLRTGEGEPFLAPTRTQELAKLTAEVFQEESDSFKSRFVTMLAGLTVEEWELLEKMAVRLAKKEC